MKEFRLFIYLLGEPVEAETTTTTSAGYVCEFLCKVKEEESSSSITLLYGTKEDRFNNAVALKEYLDEKAKNVIVS